MSFEQEIKERALDLGFDAAGITDASPVGCEHVGHFQAWLGGGFVGPLEYMHRNLEKRIEPARLRKGAKSVIVVALNYKPAVGCPGSSGQARGPAPTNNPESPIPNPQSAIGKVALYAQREDYHPFIKARLQELAGFLCARTGRTDRFKICVDSAPLAEKALAVRAGLGFIGRNHLLIHRQLGPQILLGEMVTTLPLHPDEPSTAACHDCDRCIKACPTGALRPDGFLDARKCISCITQYGPHDEAAGCTGDWLFGCDECLVACPFYQQAPASANRHFKFHPELARVNLRELLDMDAGTFEVRFHDSPVRRLGLAQLQQNARACLQMATSCQDAEKAGQIDL
jgi:epoxyqueuosine reductase